MNQYTFTRQRLIGLLITLGLLLAGCGPDPAPQAAEPAPPPAQVALAPANATHGVLPDRLVIPAIQLDTKVVELGWSATKNQDGLLFNQWDVAQYAAGWHKNSALLGAPGNLVMSGHNNILGAVFRELDQLRRGDAISVWAGQQRFDYVINDVLIVPEKYATPEQRHKNARWIGAFDDTRLTLVSCWPRDDNTHRIIVIAFPNSVKAKAVG